MKLDKKDNIKTDNICVHQINFDVQNEGNQDKQ